MKIAEQAQTDLSKVLRRHGSTRLNKIAAAMRRRGWKSVTRENMVETARDLGFLVVGTQILGIDE